MTPSKRVRIGVVGFGEWGPNHARNFANLPEARVVGIADPRPARLRAVRQQFHGVRTFSSHRDMLEALPLDALVVATPTSTHAEIVRDALAAGLHVLCEKPLCASVDEGRDLVQFAASQGCRLMVGHVFLFNAGIRRLREIVTANELGTIRYLTCRRTNLGPIRSDVNAVWDLASHDVSILNYLLDALPVRVSAVGQAYLQHRLQDVAFATLTYPNDVLAHAHVSWLDPVKVREITVVGERKMAVWNDLDAPGPIRIFDKGVVQAQSSYADFGHFQLLTREGDLTVPRIPMEEPLRVQARQFLAAIRGDGEGISGGTFALGVLKVLTAVDASIAGDGVPVAVQE